MRSTIRKILTWLLGIAFTIIVIGVGGEFLIEVARDKGIYENAGQTFDGAVAAVLDFLSLPAVSYPLGALAGLVGGVWLDAFLARSDVPYETSVNSETAFGQTGDVAPSASGTARGIASEEKRVQQRLVAAIGNAAYSAGMAMGDRSRQAAEDALPGIRSTLLSLKKHYGIQIPPFDLPSPRANIEVAKRYLIEVGTLLSDGHIEEAKEKAAQLVSESKPQMALDEPSVSSSIASSNVAVKGPQYEYPKAVLQIKKPDIMRSSKEGEITRVEGFLILRNECYTGLEQCQVLIVSMERDGIETTVMKALESGNTLITGPTSFTLGRSDEKRVRLVSRDLLDRVSRPPFLLATFPDRIPLTENTHYRLKVELRSEYEHPTRASVEILTGAHSALEIVLRDQSVGSQ
jgi:hypothetical protein